MTAYTVEASARAHLEDIYVYTLATWGHDQARSYILDFTETFEAIAAGRVRGRRIDLSPDIRGFVCRHRIHYVYWRIRSDEAVGIVAVLHVRMQQSDRLTEVWPD